MIARALRVRAPLPFRPLRPHSFGPLRDPPESRPQEKGPLQYNGRPRVLDRGVRCATHMVIKD